MRINNFTYQGWSEKAENLGLCTLRILHSGVIV